jgi:hypothetical protein
MMIIRFAHKIKASAFSAMLAYVLMLNVLLAGFAQAAILDQSLNGGGEICSVDMPDNTAKDKLLHNCQMCCLAAQGQTGLPPVVTALIARLTVVSAMLFPLKSVGAALNTAYFTQARGPPVI